MSDFGNNCVLQILDGLIAQAIKCPLSVTQLRVYNVGDASHNRNDMSVM